MGEAWFWSPDADLSIRVESEPARLRPIGDAEGSGRQCWSSTAWSSSRSTGEVPIPKRTSEQSGILKVDAMALVILADLGHGLERLDPHASCREDDHPGIFGRQGSPWEVSDRGRAGSTPCPTDRS